MASSPITTETIAVVAVSATTAAVVSLIVFCVLEHAATNWGGFFARRRRRQFEAWAKLKGRPLTDDEEADWWKRGSPPPWEVDPNDSDEPTRQS